ncbi:hypothetical protein RRG08_059545, partial [Elysia crispata]
KATSQLLLEPDWDSVLQIVDSIRMGDVQLIAVSAGSDRCCRLVPPSLGNVEAWHS